MKALGAIHIIPVGIDFALKKTGKARAFKRCRSLVDAVLEASRFYFGGYNLVIHDKTGAVQEYKKAILP